MTRPAAGRLRRAAVVLLANIAVAVALFFLIEGCASTLVIAHEIVTTPAVPEHRHAEHDTLLGWINLPGVELPDAYGPGVAVRINAQRFRNDREFPPSVPPDRIRIICSGDSFTFGYGVDNADTWCERLAGMDADVETVNLGLGGYGVDQAWLRYRRDAQSLEHQVHIFAFLSADFDRMKSDRFMGYGRPLLDVSGDSLIVTNLPVPETSWFARRRALHGESIARLRVVRVARRLFGLEPDPAEEQARAETGDRRLRDVVTRLFDDLARTTRARGSRLVLVYLPGSWDYAGVDETEEWRRWVAAEAARLDVTFLDLVEEIRKVAPTDVAALYAPNLHFSVAGNEWAAGVLHERLRPVLDSIRSALP